MNKAGNLKDLRQFFGDSHFFFALNGELGKDKGGVLNRKGWANVASGVHYNISKAMHDAEVHGRGSALLLGQKVRTGKGEEAYLCCLDFDFRASEENRERVLYSKAEPFRRSAFAWMEEYLKVKHTNILARVHTPSGGMHVYLLTSELIKNTTIDIADLGGSKVDILGKGKCCIFVGTKNKHYGKQYTLEHFNINASVFDEKSSVLYGGKPVVAARKQLVIEEGRRNDYIFKQACSMFREGRSIEVVVAHCKTMGAMEMQPPYTDHKAIEATVQSAYNNVGGGGVSTITDTKKAKREMLLEGLRSSLADYIYIEQGNQFRYISQPREVLSTKAFENKISHLFRDIDGATSQPVRVIMAYQLIKYAQRIVFDPDLPRYEEADANNVGGFLNIWDDDLPVSATGVPKRFLEHIDYLCGSTLKEKGGKVEAGHLLDWLAYNIQHPTKICSYAVLLHSRKTGVGKSYLQELLKKLLGENLVVVGQNQVTGGFTGWQESCCFAFIHEIMELSGRDVEKAMKPLIADEMINVRRMYQEAYSMQKKYNILACTNDYTGLRLGKGNRRWFVVDCNKDPKDGEYYKELFNELNDEKAVGRIANFLRKRDLSKFNPRGIAPDTLGKDIMIDASKTDIYRFLEEQMHKKEFIFKYPIINLNYMNFMELVAKDLPSFRAPFPIRNTKDFYNKTSDFLIDNFPICRVVYGCFYGGRKRQRMAFRIVRDKDKWLNMDNPTFVDEARMLYRAEQDKWEAEEEGMKI